MADVYGPTTNHWRAWLTYTVSQGPDSVTVTVKGGPQAVGWGFSISNGISTSIAVSWTGGVSGSGGLQSPTGGNGWNTHCSRTFVIPKDHSGYNGSIICTVTNRSGYMNGTSTAQASFPCPAKDHWAVTYNANGGSGAPGAQTKWHGEVLTISGTRPTRANHTFQGWSTSAGGAVQYAPNSRYGVDGGATLYAVWKLDHLPPVLSNVHASRCTAAGVANDEGTAFHVSAAYRAQAASNTPKVTGISVKWRQAGASAWTDGGTVAVNAASGTASSAAIAPGSIATDKSYEVLVTATDSNGLTASVQTGVGPSYYTMDILASGKGVAFGRACPGPGFHVQGDPVTLNGLQLCSGSSNVAGQVRSAIGLADSGWQAAASGGWEVKYRKYGPLVTLRVATANIAAGAWVRCGWSVPAGYRPKYDITNAAYGPDAAGNNVCRYTVGADGRLTAHRYGSGNTYVTWTVTYLTA